MALWDRWQQQRQWRAEFRDVSTPELRRMVGNGIYAPNMQQFLERLLRRREQPYTMLVLLAMSLMRDLASAQAAPPGAIALIEERVIVSRGGRFALVMIVLFNVVAAVAFVISLDRQLAVTSVLIWVGFNVLWGFGAVIGRKRSYVVRQPPQGGEGIPVSPKRSWWKTRAAFQHRPS